jgi:hypothetical protein
MTLNAAKIRNVVSQTFAKLGDLRQTVTYVHVAPGVYNPDTGATVDTLTSFTFLAPIVRADEKEMASFPGINNVQVVLVDYKSFPTITPTPSDYLTVAGVRWEVLRLRPSVVRAVTRIYCETP